LAFEVAVALGAFYGGLQLVGLPRRFERRKLILSDLELAGEFGDGGLGALARLEHRRVLIPQVLDLDLLLFGQPKLLGLLDHQVGPQFAQDLAGIRFDLLAAALQAGEVSIRFAKTAQFFTQFFNCLGFRQKLFRDL
jgi:hypothetical protein